MIQLVIDRAHFGERLLSLAVIIGERAMIQVSVSCQLILFSCLHLGQVGGVSFSHVLSLFSDFILHSLIEIALL